MRGKSPESKHISEENLTPANPQKKITLESPQAFEAALEPYRLQVLNYCRTFAQKLPGDAESMAEDLAQETMLRAWRSRQTFGNKGTFRNWLLTIAKNVCNNYYSKEAFKPDAVAASLSSAKSLAVSGLEPELAYIGTALLSEQQKNVLELRLQNLTFAEIGQKLGISEGAAKLCYFKAKKNLKKRTIQHLTKPKAKILKNRPA